MSVWVRLPPRPLMKISILDETQDWVTIRVTQDEAKELAAMLLDLADGKTKAITIDSFERNTYGLIVEQI